MVFELASVISTSPHGVILGLHKELHIGAPLAIEWSF